ncbi:MAG TPA: Mur ligase family protein [Nitrolancea sp.]|nr:Mur ligase family protein [Nitrolancea sp.]
MVAESALAKYEWASRYISNLIQGPPSPRPGATAEEIRARALARLDRLRQFLAFIGDPQQAYRSVHVGGTSGKGSTSALIAGILHAAGFHTGLHVSPYLQVETEKLQLDGRLMPPERFAEHVAALDAEINRWEAQGGPRLTYGEFWVALTFFSFAREALDWAVIEVGAGGRFDLTNVILSDVAVITSIGLDHTRTLGGTIPEIAWHKAGIIKTGRPAVTTVNKPDAFEVIAREATEAGAPLAHIREGIDFEVVSTGASGTEVRDLVSGETFKTTLPGQFQAYNVAAAVAAARAAGVVDNAVIGRGIAETRFAGRMEIVQEHPLVVLDGAHNPEKMDSFLRGAAELGTPRKRMLVLGSLDGHDYLTVAGIIAPFADEVIVTAPSAQERSSGSTEAIAEVVRRSGKPVEVIPEPRAAIDAALARADPADHVLVTGSLYLVGAVRERWYPSDAIVLQGTCWPMI